MYGAAGASEDGARLVDLAAPLEEDVELWLLKEADEAALKVLRHSAAHVMATAILELFPETKLGHGPATDNGFFYDVYRETPFTEADLAAIEARMAEVVARDEKFVRVEEPREVGLKEYAAQGDFMKVHFIEKFTKPGEEISLYKNGGFTDFCRGPHIPSTGRVKEESATAADLRDGVFQHEGSGRALQAAGRDQGARPQSAGQAARSVFDPGGRGGGPDLLASQGRAYPQDDGRLDARGMCPSRLRSCVHTAHHAPRAVEDQRARGLLQREYVSADGAGRRRVQAEADELSGTYSYLQEQSAQLSRPAATVCGVR